MRKLQCDVSFSHVLSLSMLHLEEDRFIFERSTGSSADDWSLTRETEGVMKHCTQSEPKVLTHSSGG